jgi:hypothetical protein
MIKKGMRRTTSPRRSSTTPPAGPSAAGACKLTASVPGTCTFSSLRPPRSLTIAARQVPAPPPASVSRTAALTRSRGRAIPNEIAVGRVKISGAAAAATLTSPAPCLAIAVSRTGVAVETSADFTWSDVHRGLRWSSNAAAAAT